MAATDKKYSLLANYRALDLTDDKGFLCGKILGDLGIDVIKVEPPRGDSARKIGPFYKNIPHPEKSLYWFAFNANKRGITLNIETSDGREIFKRLANNSDFIIESFPQGYMEELGLDYEELRKVKPSIIMTSILPFDPEGPYKDYRAPDIVGMAMSGVMFVTGDKERPPVRISFPQAYLQAASQAAAGTMIAHYHRKITGKGQRVVSSMQASLAWTLTNIIPVWELQKEIIQRHGIYREFGSQIKLKMVYSCKDGLISFLIMGKPMRHMNPFVEWMDSKGLADEHIKAIDWNDFDISKLTPKEVDELEKKVEKFFLAYTKEELYKEAYERHIPLCPVSDFHDLLKNEQLNSRDYWVQIDHPDLEDRITYPGPFLKFSETPMKIKRRAPLIGEHNEEIYVKELGISMKQLILLKEADVV